MDRFRKKKSSIRDTDNINKTKTQKVNQVNTDIELILDCKVLENRIFYLVKWIDGSNHSSWEPAEKLIGCDDLIGYFQFLVSSPESLDEKMVAYFINDLLTRKPYDILTLTKLCALIYSCTEEFINDLKLTFTELKRKASKVLDIPIEKLNSKKKHSFFNLMRFSEARKLVLSKNLEWEREINKMSSSYIQVENNVDLDEAPYSYKFVKNYVSSYVDLTENPVIFCSCEDCYKNRDKCCANSFNGDFAYDNLGHIILPPGHEIYECNRLCKCGPDCNNRVVQNGQKIKMAIFKTSNGCGWGLKTLECIPKGQFVLEYLGEVITPMDAEIRDEAFDYTGTTYLFDLDFGKESSFTVDASHRGNASRFINHSCSPNLQVYTVWIDQQDPSLPRLAFFARRKISPGEELTFDYKMAIKESELKSGEERVLCKCNSKNCRIYLL